MSLADLIEQRDKELAVKNEIAERLTGNVKNLLEEIHRWIMWYEGYTPFVYLGMQMWPKMLGEQHLNYVKGKRFLYMLTLSHEQAEAMRLSVFEGAPQGAINSNYLYEWRFDYRQDGWVELLVGK